MTEILVFKKLEKNLFINWNFYYLTVERKQVNSNIMIVSFSKTNVFSIIFSKNKVVSKNKDIYTNLVYLVIYINQRTHRNSINCQGCMSICA